MSTKLPPICGLLLLASLNLPIHAASTIEFATTNHTFSEIHGIEVLITITPPLTHNSQVLLRVLGGSAVLGTDFNMNGDVVKPDGVLVRIPAGVASYPFHFWGMDDGFPEADETVTIGLADPFPPTRLLLGTQTNLFLTIKDAPAMVGVDGYISGSEADDGELRFHRYGDTNLAFTVDYVIEGDVTPGIDFQVPASGTVSFAAGERDKTITLDLNDGIVDASWSEGMTVRLEHPSDGVGLKDPIRTFTILDSQLPTTLDLDFQLEIPGALTHVIALNDGRILTAYWGTSGTGLRILNPDGSLHRELPARFDEVSALAQAADGRILVAAWSDETQTSILRRLNLDGSLDDGFVGPAVMGQGSNSPAASPITLASDGSVYLVDPDSRLVRVNPEGRLDANFIPVTIHHALFVTTDAAGRPLLNGLRRFNLDGSPDPTFAPPLPDNAWVDGKPVMLADGKILLPLKVYGGEVGEWAQLVRLHQDGSLDDAFHPEAIKAAGYHQRASVFGLPAGDCLYFDGLGGSVTRIGLDGHVALSLPLRITGPGCRPQYFEIVGGGDGFALVGGELWAANGLQRRGLIRMSLGPPPRTGVALDYGSEGASGGEGGSAHLRVVRLGDVTRSASLRFVTRDGTAKGGKDYLPITGTVDFAAFEQAKEIEIPLLDDHELEGDESFQVLLEGLTGVEQIGPPASVTIIDDEAGFMPGAIQRREDGTVHLTFRWPRCCSAPVVQVSSDLRTWENAKGTADGVGDGVWTLVDEGAASAPVRYYRLLSRDRAAKAGRVRPHC